MQQASSRSTRNGRWTRLLEARAPSHRVSHGNRLTLLDDGDEAFRSMWQAVEAARKRVWLNTYIFKSDAVGARTLKGLVRAAERGCDVVLMYDQLGSPGLSSAFTEPLQRAGGRVVVFNPLWPSQRLVHRVGSFLHRDHRKNLVVDGRVAFAGGMNISEAYAGQALGTGHYYDTMLRVEGPAVHDLAAVFLSSVQGARQPQRRPSPQRRGPAAEGACAQVLALNTGHGQKALNHALLRALRQARQRCYLTTPYFVPPDWFKKALVQAARRGVDVRLLTAGNSDVTAAYLAGRHVYGGLLRSGVRIYEMAHPQLHAKNLVIDGIFCSVGSYNIDRWSDRHNLEMNVAAVDALLAQRLERAFFRNLEQAPEVDLRAWERRPFYVRPVQRLLYRLMRL